MIEVYINVGLHINSPFLLSELSNTLIGNGGGYLVTFLSIKIS
jgi:hypothetical protein